LKAIVDEMSHIPSELSDRPAKPSVSVTSAMDPRVAQLETLLNHFPADAISDPNNYSQQRQQLFRFLDANPDLHDVVCQSQWPGEKPLIEQVRNSQAVAALNSYFTGDPIPTPADASHPIEQRIAIDSDVAMQKLNDPAQRAQAVNNLIPHLDQLNPAAFQSWVRAAVENANSLELGDRRLNNLFGNSDLISGALPKDTSGMSPWDAQVETTRANRQRIWLQQFLSSDAGTPNTFATRALPIERAAQTDPGYQRKIEAARRAGSDASQAISNEDINARLLQLGTANPTDVTAVQQRLFGDTGSIRRFAGGYRELLALEWPSLNDGQSLARTRQLFDAISAANDAQYVNPKGPKGGNSNAAPDRQALIATTKQNLDRVASNPELIPTDPVMQTRYNQLVATLADGSWQPSDRSGRGGDANGGGRGRGEDPNAGSGGRGRDDDGAPDGRDANGGSGGRTDSGVPDVEMLTVGSANLDPSSLPEFDKSKGNSEPCWAIQTLATAAMQGTSTGDLYASFADRDDAVSCAKEVGGYFQRILGREQVRTSAGVVSTSHEGQTQYIPVMRLTETDTQQRRSIQGIIAFNAKNQVVGLTLDLNTLNEKTIPFDPPPLKQKPRQEDQGGGRRQKPKPQPKGPRGEDQGQGGRRRGGKPNQPDTNPFGGLDPSDFPPGN
jgi:hypothetical protein